MFSVSDIREEAYPAAYRRGKELYESGGVVDFSYDIYLQEGDPVAEISAKVRGREQDWYHVEAVVDEEYADVSRCNCECEAFFSYEGMCKHCVAVLLAYVNRRQAKEILSAKRGAGRGEEPAGGEEPVLSMQTPAVLKSLLNRYSLRAGVTYLIPEAVYGRVELEPHFRLAYGYGTVEFKIGIEQKYVLKSISAFLRALSQNEKVYYGKKLEFYHNRDAFTEEAWRLVQFLWQQEEDKKRQSRTHAYYVYSGGYERTMELDEVGMDRFFEAVADRPFYAELGYEGERLCRIKETEHRPKLVIRAGAAGVFLLPEELHVIKGAGYYYFYEGDRIVRSMASLKAELEEFFDYLVRQTGNGCYVAAEELPMFCRDLLPLLKQSFEVVPEGFDEGLYIPKKPEFELYLDRQDHQTVGAKLMSVYGEEKYNVLGTAAPGEVRDLAEELRIRSLVEPYFNDYAQSRTIFVLSHDEDLLYRLLTGGLQRLSEHMTIYTSEDFRGMKVVSSPAVTVGVALKSDLLELRLHSDEMSAEELAYLLTKYDRRKKYIRLKNGDFLDIRDDGLGRLAEVREDLQLTEKDLKKGVVNVPKYRAMYIDAALKSNHGLSVEKNKAFKSIVRDMKTIEDSDYEVPDSLKQVMRGYQKSGFLWLKTLRENGFGGILADDMGLGKTLQVISLLLSEAEESEGSKDAAADVEQGRLPGRERFAGQGQPEGVAMDAEQGVSGQGRLEGVAATVEQGPSGRERSAGLTQADGTAVVGEQGRPRRRSLVVCPASLVYNWQKEIRRFAPGLPTVVISGSAAERRRQITGSREGEILITSYDLLKRDAENYQDIVFAIQVIDEAQYIKNPGTQAAKGVKKITAAFKLALTGTPIENRLSELWSIFDYLMPGFLYTYQRFREEIEIPVVTEQDTEKMARLQRMIRPFILRRLKGEVLSDLPEKLEEYVFARPGQEQQQLYDAHVQHMKALLDGKTDREFSSDKIQILAELTKLRQICCDPALLFEGYRGESAKTDMCMELIVNAVGGGHKVLLFSQFTSMLDRLASRLTKEGIRYHMLTGAVGKEKRMQMVESFGKDDVPVFCISLKAGGTGLNLTAADIVIHYDPWWNVAVQNQATDRAHRIGQKHVVTVYKLVAEGTIEEKIIAIQERKQKLAEQVLGAEGMDSVSFTREEIMELLG